MFELKNIYGSPFRPYQYLMRDHIIDTPKCAAWSFMGSGKTAVTLTAVDVLLLSGDGKPALVIAPLRVARDVWPEEKKLWPHLQHLNIVPILGTAVQREDACRTKADIYTVNFENIEWLTERYKENWPFGIVVIDESTKVKSLRANVRKNPTTGAKWVQGQGGVRAKALLKTVFNFGTPRIIELTGTPSPNGLQDLWGQIFLLDYGRRLGRTYSAFQTRWFDRDFDGFSIKPKDFAQEQIQNQLKDICLSLKAEDWFDVAEPIVKPIKVKLPPEVMKKYREMERKLFTEIQGHPIEAFNAGARTMKCLQFASGAAYLGRPDDPGPRKWIEVHDEKLKALEEIVEESGGMPILVAYHFKPDLERLKKRFPKGRELDQKSQTIKDWNDGKIPLLFTHPASAGHGLSLQRGSNILVDFTCNWNAEEHQQILERIGPVRQAQSGLNRLVYRYHLVAEGTLDEEVLEAQKQKRSIQDLLLDAMRRRG